LGLCYFPSCLKKLYSLPNKVKSDPKISIPGLRPNPIYTRYKTMRYYQNICLKKLNLDINGINAPTRTERQI